MDDEKIKLIDRISQRFFKKRNFLKLLAVIVVAGLMWMGILFVKGLVIKKDPVTGKKIIEKQSIKSLKKE